MLLSIPIKPNDEGFDKLIDALENCPSITNPERRKDVIGFLGNRSKQVEERDTIRASVVSILKALSGFPNEFDSLIDGVEFYDKNSSHYNKLLGAVN